MPDWKLAHDYLESLLRSERAGPDELSAYQSKLLRRLVDHAFDETPFYAGRGGKPADLAPHSPGWLSQPCVSRSDLVENFDAFRPSSFSRLHGVITPLSTGGSTGPAARRDTTSLEALARLLASYRMYRNWTFDQSRPFFVFRKLAGENEPRRDKWGFPWNGESNLGDRTWIDIATPAAEQLQAMSGQGPVYVNTLPSNILRLSVAALRSDVRISIPFIVSVGEYLAPEVRAAAQEAFGSTIIDSFASAEGGVIAVQCPEAGLYHIQSEQVLAEIISLHGKPCAPGEAGEVIVTPLYGYATPLIRYRSGDFAEAGPACPCGRVLPTISRLLGRREHMFAFPDGTRRLPELDRVRITQTLGHDQWVLVQRSKTGAEFRHTGVLTAAARQAVTGSLESTLVHGFQLRCAQVDALPLTSGGKRHFTLNEMGN
ncbi:phenylacetate--CoA ligase family protein [Aestuariivirga sp.]|uniref:phenylacetate--CoA ligase family protein n=1 Tax=Aestuariivirga sp. TaxID=2650926 RepID=UPI00391C6A46